MAKSKTNLSDFPEIGAGIVILMMVSIIAILATLNAFSVI